jgi:hypothetical protein
MVSITGIGLLLLFRASAVFGSGYPKDVTTEWCGLLPDQELIYRCFPNPWGSGSTYTYYRFPESTKVGGCLDWGNLATRIKPMTWIFMGGGPPYLPRITFDQDKYCLDSYGGSVGTTAQPGDSIDIEFWMTPSDTIVSDTIRGWFKAYYRGNVVDLGYVPVAPKPSSAKAPRWTPAGLFLARGTTGPFDLRDLRGRSVPVRPVDQGDRLLLKPAAPLRPGLYRLRWPGGSMTFLVPGS